MSQIFSGTQSIVSNPGYCFTACGSAFKTLTGRGSTAGYLSVSEVYSRLKEWKRKPRNASTDFMNFAMIKKALQGELRNFVEVRNSQVDAVMEGCNRFLLSDEDIVKVRETGDYSLLGDTAEEEKSDDTPIHSLKRLLNSFRKLKSTGDMFRSSQKVESLKVLQQQTLEKVTFSKSI